MARRGKYAGRPFWGCSDWPRCRGLINIHELRDDADEQALDANTSVPPVVSDRPQAPEPVPRSPDAEVLHRRVSWADATTRRPGWVCSYQNGGGSLRSIPSTATQPALTQCWIARPDVPGEPTPGAVRLAAVLRKVLQRGPAPPLDPDAEQALLRLAGLEPGIRPSRRCGDLSPALANPPRLPPVDPRLLIDGGPPAPDPELTDPESPQERVFYTQWLLKVAPEAVRWTTPQAPLDALTGSTRGTGRRVDFLIQPPHGDPFVVEIDGPQHDQSAAEDQQRDAALRKAKVEVVRVPTTEVDAGDGPRLDQVRARLRQDSAPRLSRAERQLVGGPVEIHRIMLALTEAIGAGLLVGDRWRIRLQGCLAWTVETLPIYLDLMLALDVISNCDACPDNVQLQGAGRSFSLLRAPSGYLPEDAQSDSRPANSGHPETASTELVIRLEPGRAPGETLPAPTGEPLLIVRNAVLPVELAWDRAMAPRGAVPDAGWLPQALSCVLRSLFAKKEFRPGQEAALTEIVQGRDCAVLLPTGAGKSLVYQLAGLCLPGHTLVVDPLVSLIEDQIQGLRAYGIERVAAFSGYMTQQGALQRNLDELRSGQALFIFSAPERFQQEEFRRAILSMTQVAPVNLGVIDEAHCVSEWGHDFRTAYLNLGAVIRQVARKPAPPLLALTGTASRAVLKDVLVELGIDAGASDNAVVRPDSFDRTELHYRIEQVQPRDAREALVGALQSLPPLFGRQAAMFFDSFGDDTYSGIVFCPHVNGTYGVAKVASQITGELHHVLDRKPVIYAGRKPKDYTGVNWEEDKRRYAQAFKDNENPILVSTKAFGMGIDKPNVHYIVHYGMPSSIEGYYQEAGRAGRDIDRAECILILIDYDENRNRRLLEDIPDDELIQDVKRGIPYEERDDVTGQLWMHYQTFEGVGKELSAMSNVLDMLPSLGAKRSVQITWNGENAKRRIERAIHRLVVLGVIGEYLVEWRSNTFLLELRHTDSAAVVARYLDYVRRQDRQRVESEQARAGEYAAQSLTDAALGCGRLLLEFVYDVIERSRRRALREMWLAARGCQGSADVEFRRRIVDYLTEGDLTPVLERLVERQRFGYGEWLAELATVDHSEAAELRGSSGRLLASYPGHPGLLLARGLSESLLPSENLDEFSSHVASSFASARGDYSVTDAAIERAAESLRAWLTERRLDALTALALALKRAGAAPDMQERLLEQSLVPGSKEAGLKVVVLTERLPRTLRILEDLVEQLGEG